MEDELETPKPKPSASKVKAKKTVAVEPVAIYDAVVGEDIVAEPEVIVADNMEIVEEVVPVEVPAATTLLSAPPTEYAVVSNDEVDEVHLSAFVFENIYAKKVLSVHHLQRRLVEWGFREAGIDKDGWYGSATVGAVHQFQEAYGLPVGDLDMATLEAIFTNDTNVIVGP